MNPSLCLFTDSLEPSGMGQHMLTLAAELRDDYDIACVCPPTSAGRRFLDRADALGFDTLALTVRDGGSTRHQLRDWLRSRRIALFHGHAGIGWEGHDGIYAARAAGVPVVIRTEHLPYLLTAPDQRADHRRLLGQLDHLICVSAAAHASFLAVGVPEYQVCVVRNGIGPPTASTDRRGLREECGLPAGAHMILTVGRFTAQKGHRILIEAMPAVVVERPDAHFVWVGLGPLEAELRASVRERGLTDRVHFIGERTDVPDLMAAADLFVLPSLFEGLPLVVLEAMAAGLPIVGTDVCGTAEAVVDGVTGRLVDAGDAGTLAAAIVDALAEPDLAARWGAAGRRRVACLFSASRMAREMGVIYAGALTRHVPGTRAEWLTSPVG